MTISSVPEVLDINHIGQSGVAAKRMHTFLTSITSTLGNISSPFSFKGAIAVNTSFPLAAAVQTGWFYTITAAVTDNAGVTYTNTGLAFSAGDEIAWNGSTWVVVGASLSVYDAVIAVANATGGGTTAALTLSLQDVNGVAAAKVCVAKIIATATQYAGAAAMDASPTFGSATVGSILGSGNGWAVVKTSATGAFACTVTNATDETLYFTACTSDGGVDALAAGAVIRGCVPDAATWSA